MFSSAYVFTSLDSGSYRLEFLFFDGLPFGFLYFDTTSYRFGEGLFLSSLDFLLLVYYFLSYYFYFDFFMFFFTINYSSFDFPFGFGGDEASLVLIPIFGFDINFF